MTNPTPAAKPATPAKPGSADQRADQIRDQVLALDVKRVADWIGALIRTIKASRTYPANSPTLHKFQAELESRTWSCLKEVGDITLVVQQFDLLYENYSVYHNADRNESLAFRFYGDGVREITFQEGLEPHELRGIPGRAEALGRDGAGAGRRRDAPLGARLSAHPVPLHLA